MKDKKSSLIVKHLAIAVLAIVIGFYLGSASSTAVERQITNINTSQGTTDETVSMMIDYGDGTVSVFSKVVVDEDTSVFDLLETVASENAISLETEDFGGDLGVFVSAISGVGGENDKWWQFWVNNEYSMIGMSNHKLEAGDVVSLKFIKGQPEE